MNYKILTYNKNNLNINVRFDEEKNTIWLTQSEIALIFNTAKDTIKKNIKRISLELNNISGGDSQSPTELDEEIVGYDGKTYKTKLLNISNPKIVNLSKKLIFAISNL